MTTAVTAAWIEGDWIYSEIPEQSGRYWIHDNWIWGPLGAEHPATHYWIMDGWIWGPKGASDTRTDFYIAGGWICGPRMRLPFVDEKDIAPRPA